MKRVNRSWVTIIDTDEYITFNRFSHGDPTLLELNFSQYATTTRDNLIRARTRLPITGGDTTAYSFIQQESDNLPWAYQSCVPMFRLQFGLRETPMSQLEREDDLSLPAGYKTTDYYTTRYFQHRPKGSCNKNCKGKTMIDVSRIPDDHLIHSDTILTGVLPPAAVLTIQYQSAMVHWYRITQHLFSECIITWSQ
mmetsp:Transcript_282/g.341  ORF Transcript_282/g.341 Transcript_282/m.341 type:complete len:195 (-) Transcript_282:135-719(-)